MKFLDRGRGEGRGYCTKNQENRLLREKAPEVCSLFSINFFLSLLFSFKKIVIK